MAIKVGIIGCNGFVGSAFFKAFSEDKKYQATGIDRSNFEELRGTKFDILINANGNSSKRLADSDPKKDWEMNVESTRRFLGAFPCGNYVHISSIDVYLDKSSPKSTGEDAKIDPSLLSNYGKSKYAGEQVARTHKSFLILRLAGMVGEGMKKGPAYDILHSGKLYISEKSRYQFMRTGTVAHIAKTLAERGKWGEIYNVCGDGNMGLSEFAALAGVKLSSCGASAQEICASTEKLGRVLEVPGTKEEIAAFLASLEGRGRG